MSPEEVKQLETVAGALGLVGGLIFIVSSAIWVYINVDGLASR